MDIAQMRMMLVLADCESMTSAAKKLKVTQPALSYQLKTIEAELGFKMFDRTRTGTSITPQGEFLLAAISSFLADYEEALRCARALAVGKDGATASIEGTAVIGTIAGDEHDIGKNLVRIALESRDIEVADLGKAVQPDAFVDHVASHPLCSLVLVSVNRNELREGVASVVRSLSEAGLRDRVSIMVGGAAASAEFAESIGADAYTDNADDAAHKACELMRG